MLSGSDEIGVVHRRLPVAPVGLCHELRPNDEIAESRNECETAHDD
jgi:hypothetical protein